MNPGKIRKRVIELIVNAGKGHIGGSLSCVEILCAIYNILQPNDRVILSKGHAVATLYAILEEKGLIDASTFNQEDSELWGHPNFKVNGIDVTTGSLGNGLGIGCGLALAGHRTFVVMGDGECEEGSVWEAANFANNEGLDNLIAIIDNNGIEATDGVQGNIVNKFTGFGWASIPVYGHNISWLEMTLTQHMDCPTVIMARTVKGKGLPFAESKVEWHHKVPTREQVGLA